MIGQSLLLPLYEQGKCNLRMVDTWFLCFSGSCCSCSIFYLSPPCREQAPYGNIILKKGVVPPEED